LKEFSRKTPSPHTQGLLEVAGCVRRRSEASDACQATVIVTDL
jgi:hypothetical protein